MAQDSEANIVVAEDGEQVAKFLQVRDRLPHLKAIIQYIGEPKQPGVLSWSQFLALGAAEDDHDLQERLAHKANQCCTLIYTSGTTGPPKGVMLSHDNVTWTAGRMADLLGLRSCEEHILSYLPLSHVAAQVWPCVSSHVGHFVIDDHASLVVKQCSRACTHPCCELGPY